MNWKSSFSSLLLFALAGGSLAATSLWISPNNDERGMFARNIASSVGDLLTVNISESTSLSTDGVSITKAAQTSTAKSEALRLLSAALPGAFRVGRDESGNPIGVDLAQLFGGDYSGGEGTLSNTTSVTTVALTVHVTDVLPNGNLIIEGGKALSIAEEVQYVVLRGIVRPSDVGDDNAISSSRVASASIEFIGEGALSDTQNKGWLTRLLDDVSPF